MSKLLYDWGDAIGDNGAMPVVQDQPPVGPRQDMTPRLASSGSSLLDDWGDATGGQAAPPAAPRPPIDPIRLREAQAQRAALPQGQDALPPAAELPPNPMSDLMYEFPGQAKTIERYSKAGISLDAIRRVAAEEARVAAQKEATASTKEQAVKPPQQAAQDQEGARIRGTSPGPGFTTCARRTTRRPQSGRRAGRRRR